MPEKSGHGFVSENRENIKIYGVEDVVSFDDGEVVLKTSCGDMTVEGQQMRIGVLDTASGRVEIDGHIDGLLYFDNSVQKKKLFGKR